MLNSKRNRFVILIVIIMIFLVSCTAGPNDLMKVANQEGNLAGFFKGLWHGFILLFSFIVSLFNSNVNVYEVHNVGPLYNLGFLIGVSCFFGGSGSAGKKGRKK